MRKQLSAITAPQMIGHIRQLRQVMSSTTRVCIVPNCSPFVDSVVHERIGVDGAGQIFLPVVKIGYLRIAFLYLQVARGVVSDRRTVCRHQTHARARVSPRDCQTAISRPTTHPKGRDGAVITLYIVGKVDCVWCVRLGICPVQIGLQVLGVTRHFARKHVFHVQHFVVFEGSGYIVVQPGVTSPVIGLVRVVVLVVVGSIEDVASEPGGMIWKVATPVVLKGHACRLDCKRCFAET
jgi:hypothetical protein